ncbi:protein-tyrosine sulfotransferase-like [Salvia splendens]|uniref:protein-tyrosine sulfotransferase-like n=1 Tax=Salvia splendens TaxID=180675 RepID=UPI001C263A5E|nr:protein-tyrosine sulfotransferase-like [Salvia splendens]XP_041989786.1 protein-tyrosine sulfotransferase-like [Salvia splendens]
MRCEIVPLMLGFFLLLLVSVPVTVEASEANDGYKQCEHTVKKWASFSADTEVSGNQHALRDLLLFLHVPRTGGRTYYHCFLKKLYSSSLECPRSYDKLRYNSRKSSCRLLSTHDDYSVMSKLPRERTSLMTILRDPIERVFSTYEFSLEVASRFLIHPNLTSVLTMSRSARRKTSGVNTLDIWPWKYLVPWMREDLFSRRDIRKLRGQVNLVAGDPYDMEDIAMPLHEYINEPVTRDIVHNGATFQIVGLTNNSYFTEAHEVRHCVLKYHSLGDYVLQVAKKKLDNMIYVGLTENHKESANMFANVVATQVISKHKTSSSNSDGAGDNDSEQHSQLPDMKTDANDKDQNQKNVSSTGEDNAIQENWTVGKLMKAYNSCVLKLRNSQADRRVNSLKQLYPANFTKEARKRVPEALIKEITLLNSLDVELYKYGQYIFGKQQEHMTQSMVHDEEPSGMLSTSTYHGIYNTPSWKFVSLSAAALMPLLIFIFIFVSSRRRTSKVKL